jgi:hypothetical protein
MLPSARMDQAVAAGGGSLSAGSAGRILMKRKQKDMADKPAIMPRMVRSYGSVR